MLWILIPKEPKIKLFDGVNGIRLEKQALRRKDKDKMRGTILILNEAEIINP